MITMKRLLRILIAGLILYGFSACGSGLDEVDNEEQNQADPTSSSNKYGQARFGLNRFSP